MPGRVVEVDDVARWNSRDLVEGKVIVADFVFHAVDELLDAHPFRCVPHALCDLTGQSHAVAFLVQSQTAVCDHVDQNATDVLVLWWVVAVPGGEVLRSQEVLVAVRVDEFFSVKEDQVDSIGWLNLPQVVRKFHEQRDAAGSVICSNERSSWTKKVAVGIRSRVVMAAQQDSLFRSWIPRDDQVRHSNRPTVDRVCGVECLSANLAAELLKVLDDKLLLTDHPVGTTDPRANPADLFQVIERPICVALHIELLGLSDVACQGDKSKD